MAKFCINCRNKVGFVFNREKVCSICAKQICGKCAIEGVKVFLCNNCLDSLKNKKEIGPIYYCDKCNKFGYLKKVSCNYCESSSCTSCSMKAGCIDDHNWCTKCEKPLIKEVMIPKVKKGEGKNPIRNANDSIVGYNYFYNPYWGERKIRVCPLDKQDTFLGIIGKAFKGLDISLPQDFENYNQSFNNFIEVVKPEIFSQLKEASQKASFEWRDTFDYYLPIITDKWDNELAFRNICLETSDSELKTYLCDYYAELIGQPEITNFKQDSWEAIIPYLSLDFLNNNPGFAAMHVWVGSNYLSDKHKGMELLYKLNLSTSFFQGMNSVFQGLIEIDVNLCLEGLKNVHRDNTIPANITNIVIKDIETGIENIGKLSKEKIKIDQRGAVLGDVVQEKVGSKTEFKDTVVFKPSIGGHEQDNFKICPYCGKELNLPESPRFCPYCEKKLMV